MDSLGFIYLNIIKIKELVDLAYNYLPSNEAEHFWPSFFPRKKICLLTQIAANPAGISSFESQHDSK